jgi:hypothetical protein
MDEPFSGDGFKGNGFPLFKHNKIDAGRLYNQDPKMTTKLTHEPEFDT